MRVAVHLTLSHIQHGQSATWSLRSQGHPAQANQLLRPAKLGVTLADLQHDARPALPTFDEYLPQVLAAAGPGALRAYRSY